MKYLYIILTTLLFSSASYAQNVFQIFPPTVKSDGDANPAGAGDTRVRIRVSENGGSFRYLTASEEALFSVSYSGGNSDAPDTAQPAGFYFKGKKEGTFSGFTFSGTFKGSPVSLSYAPLVTAGNIAKIIALTPQNFQREVGLNQSLQVQYADFYDNIINTISSSVTMSEASGKGSMGPVSYNSGTKTFSATYTMPASPGPVTINVVSTTNAAINLQIQGLAVCGTNKHAEGGACVDDTRVCSVLDGASVVGSGLESWLGSQWSSCVAQSCISSHLLQNGQCNLITYTAQCADPVNNLQVCDGTVSQPKTLSGCINDLTSQSSSLSNCSASACSSQSVQLQSPAGEIVEDIDNGQKTISCDQGSSSQQIAISCNGGYREDNGQCVQDNQNITVTFDLPPGTLMFTNDGWGSFPPEYYTECVNYDGDSNIQCSLTYPQGTNIVVELQHLNTFQPEGWINCPEVIEGGPGQNFCNLGPATEDFTLSMNGSTTAPPVEFYVDYPERGRIISHDGIVSCGNGDGQCYFYSGEYNRNSNVTLEVVDLDPEYEVTEFYTWGADPENHGKTNIASISLRYSDWVQVSIRTDLIPQDETIIEVASCEEFSSALDEVSQRRYSTLKLMADLDLDACSGNPGQRRSSSLIEELKGKIDGNGHKLSNYKSSKPMFNLLAQQSCISNLKVKNADVVSSESTNAPFGILFGDSSDSCLNNVAVDGSISVSGGHWWLGGIGGRVWNTRSDKVSFFGKVIGVNAGTVGGMFGEFSGWENAELSNSFVQAYVQGATDSLGGISGSTVYDARINNSYSRVALNTAHSANRILVGGITGYVYSKIENCYTSPILNIGGRPDHIIGLIAATGTSSVGSYVKNIIVEGNPTGVLIPQGDMGVENVRKASTAAIYNEIISLWDDGAWNKDPNQKIDPNLCADGENFLNGECVAPSSGSSIVSFERRTDDGFLVDTQTVDLEVMKKTIDTGAFSRNENGPSMMYSTELQVFMKFLFEGFMYGGQGTYQGTKENCMASGGAYSEHYLGDTHCNNNFSIDARGMMYPILQDYISIRDNILQIKSKMDALQIPLNSCEDNSSIDSNNYCN